MQFEAPIAPINDTVSSLPALPLDLLMLLPLRRCGALG